MGDFQLPDADIVVDDFDDIEYQLSEFLELYERPPEGADPDDPDDPMIGEDGTLEVEPTEIILQFNVDPESLPDSLSFSKDFMGWDYSLAMESEAHGLESHGPALITISLVKYWDNPGGGTLAEYKISAEHD